MLSQLARLFRGNRELSTFTICVVLSFTLMALPPSAKDAVSHILATPLRPFKSLKTMGDELAGVRDENQALRRMAARLMDEKRALIEYKHENDRLRELMSFLVSFPEEEHLALLPAKVIGMPGVRTIETIEIDRGSLDGISAGRAVLVPDGLVGKVVRVQADRAQVEPLASAASAVSVTIERSRVRGVVKARYGGPGGLLSWEIDYVPARSDVEPGDLVVTSGLGGVFPPGLTVGTVQSIEEGPLTMRVRLALAVDFSTVEQVFVVTGTRASLPGRSEAEERLLRELERSQVTPRDDEYGADRGTEQTGDQGTSPDAAGEQPGGELGDEETE
jgi:rod shape-determining protein MreC